MDDKNELNDLLMGNQKESSGSGKKIFLISTGVLLLSFVGIGVMKFVGSSDTKQPLPITSIESTKKPDSAIPAPSAGAAPSDQDVNGSAPVGEDKLNEIVKKLQQDAQAKVGDTAAQTQNMAPATQDPMSKQAVESVKPIDPKATAAAAQIKTLSEQTPQEKQIKKEEPKKAQTETAKQTPQQKPAAKQEEEAKVKADAKEAYYIQVGYFKNEAPIKELQNKVKVSGYSTTIRQGDKNVSKVWVGPFETKNDADKALPRIKTKIKNDAFVIKE